MKKIPTIFERDWNGDRGRVVNQVHPGCEWVMTGEGIATRKIDGSCCMIRSGKLFKRRELRSGDIEPADFELADHDTETGKTVGWVPVGEGQEDRWHRVAFERNPTWMDGTYELIGPKVQGNPEHWDMHDLVAHGSILEEAVPREFEALRGWLEGKDIEGLVFHHHDGRMAKIKLRDFGIKRRTT